MRSTQRTIYSLLASQYSAKALLSWEHFSRQMEMHQSFFWLYLYITMYTPQSFKIKSSLFGAGLI